MAQEMQYFVSRMRCAAVGVHTAALLTLMLFICINATVGAPFVNLQQGLTSEYTLTSAEAALLFKVEQTGEPAGTVMRVLFSACTVR